MPLRLLISLGLILTACKPAVEKVGAASDQQAKAVEALTKYGHKVYAKGAPLSDGDGHVASLYEGYRTEGEGIRAEDARLLSHISDLVEIRVLPVGGPPKEFWDNLGRVETLLDFAAHYGLEDHGLQGLAKFPNLRTLTIWGRSTHLGALPDLPKLRILHVEETMINADDIRRIEEACPQLEEFVCDDLDEEALEILKSIKRIKNVSAGDYETGETTGQ